MIRYLGSGEQVREAWEGVLASDPYASITQTPAWLDCIRSTGHYEDMTRAYETTDGRSMVLPLCRQRYRPSPIGAAEGWPEGWDLAGALATDGVVTPADVAAIVRDLLRGPLARTALWIPPRPDRPDVWVEAVPAGISRVHRTLHVLDLSPGFDALWRDSFTGKVRSACRKAVRRGVEVESDRSGRLITVFHELYLKSVDRWAHRRRQPIQLARMLAARRESQAKFAAVAARLDQACAVRIAWYKGQPVAGTIVLSHGRVATYWRGAMDSELIRGTGANDLLHRLAIEEACAAGHRFYDLGVSVAESLARFKESFGARALPYQGYRVERLPLTKVDRASRQLVKRLIGMQPP
jgi:hypothetical protein